jgi:tight adherence protein B
VVVTRSVSIAACFAVFGAFAPTAIVARYRNRRAVELREAWPEAIDNLVSAVRAGMALPDAVAALASNGPEPLRPAFAEFARGYAVSGDFNATLDTLKRDLADPVADQMIDALRTTHAVGGTQLVQALQTLSTFLREDARTRAELETRQGWTVNAARLAVAAPWVVLLLLATASSTLSAYDSTTGRIVLAVGAGLCLVAYRVMLRIGRLPTEKRVLR